MTVIIDLAGSHAGGGAGRFREQLFNAGRQDQAIGLDTFLTPTWILKRELIARRAVRAIAANNAGFVNAGLERWVLARNANHFMTEEERQRTWHIMPRSFRVQVPYVRASMRRADVIVAPSQSMANRIVRILPSVANRVVVRFHPLQAPRRDPRRENYILCPIVPSPFKALPERLSSLQLALPPCSDIRVIATAHSSQMPSHLVDDHRFSFVGTLDRTELAAVYSKALAVYYPTDVESFGYPLAEARASGMPVIALDVPHNHDVAGAMLCGFSQGSVDSLASAIHRATTEDFVPDPQPFDPIEYFRWLLD